MTRRTPFRRMTRFLTPFGWRAVLLATIALIMTVTLGGMP